MMEIIYRFDGGLGSGILFGRNVWYATYYFDSNKLFKSSSECDNTIMKLIIAYLKTVGIEPKVVD